MKAFVLKFVAFCGALLVLYALVVSLCFAHVLFPPTLAIGIAVNVDPSGMLAAVPYLLLFVLTNIYLLVRVSRRKALLPFRAGLPSLCLTLLVAVLSVRYWFWPIAHHPTDGPLGGVEAGLQIQGSPYVWSYGIINLAGFTFAVIILYHAMRKRPTPGFWLAYNWAIYASLFLFLFPWLGGLP